MVAFSLLLHVLRHTFSAASAGVSQDIFAVSQLVAHATPFPGAKQLAKAVSNSALQSTVAAETLQVFFIAVACLMQAVVAGLKARGKHGGVIACALAHRANRIAYALVRDQACYDPTRWASTP